MQLQPGLRYPIRDAQQRLIGWVTIETVEGDRVTGTFLPGPDYPAVADLFRAFEEAVNQQALGEVEKIDQRLAALGLRLGHDDAPSPVAIHDVQVWSDGAISCRSGQQETANGVGADVRPQPLESLLPGSETRPHGV